MAINQRDKEVLAQNCPVLIDERLDRVVAGRHSVQVADSAGILLAAKDRGLVCAVGPILAQRTSSGYRLSDNLIVEVLRRANELE